LVKLHSLKELSNYLVVYLRLDTKFGEYMRSPRNIPDAAQTPEPGAMGRAIGVFKKSGDILNTKRAVKLRVHLRELYALRDAGKLERLERGRPSPVWRTKNTQL